MSIKVGIFKRRHLRPVVGWHQLVELRIGFLNDGLGSGLSRDLCFEDESVKLQSFRHKERKVAISYWLWNLDKVGEFLIQDVARDTENRQTEGIDLIDLTRETGHRDKLFKLPEHGSRLIDELRFVLLADMVPWASDMVE